MPDFHTRRARGPNEPDGLAVRSHASKLRSLSIANRLGTLLIGGVVLSFAIVAVYVAPPLYPSNEQASGGHEEETTGGDRQRAANELACGTDFLSKTGNCHPPSPGEGVEICEADTYGHIDTTKCRPAPSEDAEKCEAEGYGESYGDLQAVENCRSAP